MSKMKLNLRQLPVTEKIAKARKIVTALTENASFPNPTPPLETITAAVNAFDAAFAATQVTRQQVKTRISDQSTREEALDQLMIQLAAHVESVAGANENLIHSAGMDTKAAPSASAMPTPPLGLRAIAGDHDGEIVLSWDKVAQAKTYVVEKSLDPPTATSWAHEGVATRSSMMIDELTSGTRYWFRVAAVGASGQSGWSAPTTRIAP